MSLSADVLRTVGHHFVTLSCVQVVPGKAEELVHVFSGFVIDVLGVWFYVTAGHIPQRIRRAEQTGAKFDVWRLGDQTAGRRFDSGIPYAMDIEQWLVIEDEEQGLDYAVVVLGGLYRLQLEAGGIEPIGSDAWGDHATEFDQWALIGIPSESVAYDGKTIINAKVVVAPLRLTEPPAAAGEKVQNQFYGELKDDSAGIVKDVDGMSGGPIFGLKKVEGTWRYKVVGVQSAWYPRMRVIAACPISSLAHALEEVVRSVQTARSGENPRSSD